MPPRLDLALIVGHRRSDPGASGHGLTEYGFHAKFALLLAGYCGEAGLRTTVIERDDTPTGYKALPAKVNATGARFAVSLHLNAHDSDASGSEALYWHTSHGDRDGDGVDDGSRALAALLQLAQVEALELPDRGLKPIEKGHRGWYVLRYTTMPCALIEPCFVSNAGDVERLVAREFVLARKLARACAAYSAILPTG